MGNDLFETFDNGSLRLPKSTAEFADIPWTKHPAFDGVELKHIVSAKDTAGQFSYHLVRIAPGKSKASALSLPCTVSGTDAASDHRPL